MKEAAQHQLLRRSRHLDQGGVAATSGAAAAGEVSIDSARGEQGERTDRVLEGGIGDEGDPSHREAAKAGGAFFRLPHGARGRAVESR